MDMKYEKNKEYKLTQFALEMQKELLANTHKGDWEEFLNIDEIQSELDYHVDKVFSSVASVEISNENKDMLREHIADCANILMFLGNAYSLYESK